MNSKFIYDFNTVFKIEIRALKVTMFLSGVGVFLMIY